MASSRRRFRFMREIAEGGFGKVYLAEQLSADGFSRIVAIKLLHAKWSSHDEVVMRTRDEARLLGLIRHQHIVRVEDLTAIDGKCAIIMEYLEGVDLKGLSAYLNERGECFPRTALFEMMEATVSALDMAYNGPPLQGGDPLRVIHRDIKPSNIFATISGGLKVLDFGTARADFAEREAKTQALAFGSQGYMAPERMLGEEDTPAADVFSLGVTLYELLEGHSFGRIPPRPNKFEAKLDEKLSSLNLNGSPEWCEQVRETLRSMLAYIPTERPSAASLVARFEQLSEGADDMPMRRFCRTVVAEAKAAEETVDTGDPLTGQTLEENLSMGFAIGLGGVPVSDGQTESALGLSSGTSPPPPVSGHPPAPVEPSLSQDEIDGVTVVNESLSGVVDVESQEEPAGSSIKVILAGVLVLVGLGVVGVIGLGLVGYYLYESGQLDGMMGVERAEPVEELKPPPSTGPTIQGQTIKISDSREPQPVWARTTLHFSDLKGADITIRGGGGFSADWDGLADFDLGALAPGPYRTIVKPVGQKKVRGKKFIVSKDGGICSFTFDLGVKDWVGGCE